MCDDAVDCWKRLFSRLIEVLIVRVNQAAVADLFENGKICIGPFKDSSSSSHAWRQREMGRVENHCQSLGGNKLRTVCRATNHQMVLSHCLVP